MKKLLHLLWLLPLLFLCVAAVLVTPGQKISGYPHTNAAPDSSLIVIAHTNALVPTNYNISAAELRLQFTNGLATTSYVNTATGSIVFPVTMFETLTNAVRIGLTTNGNWEYGVTGRLSGTTVHLGVDAAQIVTNSGGFINTNLGINTNPGIFSVQYEPNRGSLWYSGTNGIPETNGARSAMEFVPAQQAFRVGALENSGGTIGFIPGISNYWNTTNTGYGSTIIGSNNLAQGNYSVVFGVRNQVYSNSTVSAILSGTNSLISTNSPNSVIAGGQHNTIHNNQFSSFIGSGEDNIISSGGSYNFIGGGLGNDVPDSTQYAVISGGLDNDIRGSASSWAFIGGGQVNKVQSSSTHSSIAGGHANLIGESSANPAIRAFVGGGKINWVRGGSLESAIVGGLGNTILAEKSFIGGGWTNYIDSTSGGSVICGGVSNLIGANSTNSFIVGGSHNTVLGKFSFAIGHSNVVTATNAGAIGFFVVNTQAGTVKISGLNLSTTTTVLGPTNATVGGLIIGISTPVASAGAAETNLIAVTIPAHTLTNTGDRVTFRTSGRFAATAENKDIKLVFGSATILDTTAQLVNGGAWVIEGEIVRTGNTSQSASAEFHGAGVTLFTTAASLDLAETNGIATVLKITSTAASDGAVTNRHFTTWLWPSP